MKVSTAARAKTLGVFLTGALLLSLWAGCGEDGVSGPADPEVLAQEGWQLFASGRYSEAISKFEEAISFDPDLATAYNGLGWCYMRLGQLETSRDKFTYVLSVLVKRSPETYAGAAIVHLALKNYGDAAWMASQLFERYGDSYEFQYDPHVTDVTIRLVRALSSFHEGDYDSAYADALLLGGPLLNTEANDFVARLLVVLQDLRDQLGQGLARSDD